MQQVRQALAQRIVAQPLVVRVALLVALLAVRLRPVAQQAMTTELNKSPC